MHYGSQIPNTAIEMTTILTNCLKVLKRSGKFLEFFLHHFCVCILVMHSTQNYVFLFHVCMLLCVVSYCISLFNIHMINSFIYFLLIHHSYSYLDLAQILLEAGAKVDYREPTDELYPRTTLCDEPLRLALKNQHYVSCTNLNLSFCASWNYYYISNENFNRMSHDCYWNMEQTQIKDISSVLKLAS